MEPNMRISEKHQTLTDIEHSDDVDDDDNDDEINDLSFAMIK